jgi:cytochrome c556
MNTTTAGARLRLLLLTLAAPFLFASCGDSPEKVTEDMISVMNRMGDTLEGIKDKATAEAAKDKLKSLGDEMSAIKARMEKVAKPGGDAEKALKEKYEKDLEAAMKKMGGAMMKVAAAGPEAQEVVKGVMEQFKDLK